MTETLTRIRERLKSRMLRITPSRLAVLETLEASQRAMSFPQLEKVLHEFDRSTIFRTLQTLNTHRLLHTIPDEEGQLYYAYTSRSCEKQPGHAHFFCRNCRHTTCLSQMAVPEVTVPQHFSVEEIEIFVYGLCGACVNVSP